MAPRLSTAVCRALRPRPTIWRCRFYSTAADEAAPAPPFLQKLKGELKTAMRAKDAPRLSALRAILSASQNVAKSSAPIKTDAQLVALVRRIRKDSEQAAAEAKAAGRDDVVDQEEQQIRIMDEYMAGSGVESLGGAELRAMIQDTIAAVKSEGLPAKTLQGEAMKRLMAVFKGKDVDRKQAADMVKELIG